MDIDREKEEKKIDESYKTKVDAEKQKEEDNSSLGDGISNGQFVPPKADFSFFVTTLAMQATISLGDMANPQSNKKEEDLKQAKFIIDTLGMLEEKTKNNLNKEESALLENILYDLRMRYVEKTKV